MARHRIGPQDSRRHRAIRRLKVADVVLLEQLETRLLLSAVTVDNTFDDVNGDTSSIASLIANHGGDGISLREAILAANNTAGADAITFDAGLSGGTITLTGGVLRIHDDVTIVGLGANQLTISGNNRSQIFSIRDAAVTKIAVEMSGLTLIGGNAYDGGAIENYEHLTLTDCRISENYALFSGGGIDNNGDLTLINCTFSQNSANSGGAVASGGGVLTVIDCTFDENYGEVGGGGIAGRGTIAVTNSTFSRNVGAWGAAIGVGGTATLTDCTFSRNAANSGGGGAIGNSGTMTVTNCKFGQNTVSHAEGGGIFNQGTLTLIDSVLAGNFADVQGGAIYNVSGYSVAQVTLIDTTLSGNIANGGGGGIANNGGMVSVFNSTIDGNKATSGGGIYNFGGEFTSINSTFVHNSARLGGGIANTGTISLTNDTLSSNSVDYGIGKGVHYLLMLAYRQTAIEAYIDVSDGGGIFNIGTLTLNNNLVAGNSAAGNGSEI